MDAAIVVAPAPLRDARRRVGFMSQIKSRTLVAVLDHGATRGCSVQMLDEGTAAGAVRWRRRVHGALTLALRLGLALLDLGDGQLGPALAVPVDLAEIWDSHDRCAT